MRPRLRSFEVAWIDAAFDAIYPEAGTATPVRSHLPHGIASMHPARFFDEVLASVPFEQSLGLRVTLWMIALAPLFTIRRLGTIASIGEADRTRVLERLVTSPIYVVRQLAMSFKAIATLLYVQSAPIRAAMTVPLRPKMDGLVSATRLLARPRRDDVSTTTTGGEHEHAAE
jgi:hypothetical protein